MTRRFQFSLRWLYGFAVLVCLFLGCKHLVETYGNRLDVEEVRIGAPVHLKARYFCVFGPRECWLRLGYKEHVGGSDTRASETLKIKRRWLCLYVMECEIAPIDEPGRIVVFFERDIDYQMSKFWTLKEETVDVK